MGGRMFVSRSTRAPSVGGLNRRAKPWLPVRRHELPPLSRVRKHLCEQVFRRGRSFCLRVCGCAPSAAWQRAYEASADALSRRVREIYLTVRGLSNRDRICQVASRRLWSSSSTARVPILGVADPCYAVTHASKRERRARLSREFVARTTATGCRFLQRARIHQLIDIAQRGIGRAFGDSGPFAAR